MYSFLSRYGQMIALAIGVFITVVMFIIIGLSGPTFDSVADLPRIEYNEALSQTGIFNFAIVASLILIAVTALAILVFGLFGIITNFKNSVKGLIGFGVLLVVFVIAWVVAGSMGDPQGVLDVIDKMNNKGAGITPGISNFVSASLIMTLVLGGIAFIGLIASEIWNLFR